MTPRIATNRSAARALTLAGASKPTPPAPTAITIKITSKPSSIVILKAVPIAMASQRWAPPPRRLTLLRERQHFVVEGDDASRAQDCLPQPPHAEEKQQDSHDELNFGKRNLAQRRAKDDSNGQKDSNRRACSEQRA